MLASSASWRRMLPRWGLVFVGAPFVRPPLGLGEGAVELGLERKRLRRWDGSVAAAGAGAGAEAEVLVGWLERDGRLRLKSGML
jgi:hypothetical protein